jgi:hypothetical protein
MTIQPANYLKKVRTTLGGYHRTFDTKCATWGAAIKWLLLCNLPNGTHPPKNKKPAKGGQVHKEDKLPERLTSSDHEGELQQQPRRVIGLVND